MKRLHASNGGPRYPIDELCQLRTTLPVIACVISRINKHPDIAGIFRLPEEAFRNPNRFSCETRKLALISNQSATPRSVKRQLGSSSEESEYHNKVEVGASGDPGHVQWNLRRREEAARSSQPYDAPPGLVAQQSENFQRFYRAVVSPTHVRVTAGGRIVPNTRVAATPSFEWNSEKQHFEPMQSPPDESNHVQPSFWPQNTSASSAFPSFHPNGNMPPYHFLQHGNMLPLMPRQQPAGAYPFVDKKIFEGETDLKINGKSRLAPQPIKISPPDQFDQTKPFIYNGQVVYPVPQGFQPPANAMPVPIAMLGNPNFLPGPAAAPGFFPHHIPMPMASMPFTFPTAGQHFPMQTHQPLGQAPFMGLTGMMSVSELTKNQLNDLRQLLKTIDHQLANNKHQIDMALMLQQRGNVESQIDTMQNILRAQLSNEMNSQLGTRGESVSESSERSTASAENKIALITESLALSSPLALKPQQSAAVASSVTPKIIESPKHEKIQATSNGSLTTRAASHSISRLSAAAAMAPPFQPRSIQVPNNIAASLESSDASGVPINGIHIREEYARPIGFLRTQTFQEPPQNTSSGHSGLQRSNTFHGQTAAAAAMKLASSNQVQGIPYLVGTLPTGIKPSEATSQDLTYSRPLTNEEVRARYLYWGKAPRHIQSGLPKFDGKDFYPPSPVKEIALLASPKVPKLASRPVLPDFSNLFTEPGAPGYKMPSPVRPLSGYSHLTTVVDSTVDYRPVQRHLFTSNLAAAQTISGDRISYQPPTPNSKRMVDEGFSSLFLEPGVAGYKSPSPPQEPRQAIKFANLDNSAAVRDWTATSASPARNDEASDTSTVEIHLSPQVSGTPKPKIDGVDTPFAERVANFASTGQQTLFLQNMLRNTATMSSPALLGGVTSATAQGYLPQYRGSAAASLSPAILNVAGIDRGQDNSTSKIDSPKVANGSSFGVTVLSENLPLSRAIPIVRPPPDSMDAEGYMRYLSQKAADDQLVKEHGWNTNTTGTGPVSGADW